MQIIEHEPPSDWRQLQSSVERILREAGFETTQDKTTRTVRGRVALDVRAVDRLGTPPTTFLFECKFWKRRVPKAVIHGFRSVVSDCGAHGGWIVARSGFQRGALETAEGTNVRCLTWDTFQDLFADRWFSQWFVPQFTAAHDQLASLTFPIDGLGKSEVDCELIDPQLGIPLWMKHQGLDLIRVACSVEPGFQPREGATLVSHCRGRMQRLPIGPEGKRLVATAPLRTLLSLLLQSVAIATADIRTSTSSTGRNT